MFDDLRLTELHEEWGHAAFMARTVNAGVPTYEHRAAVFDAEIRRRVAAQEIGPPYLFRTAMGNRPAIFCGVISPLLCGIPDAEREYPRRRPGMKLTGPGIDMWSGASFESWVNHAAHYIPVEGCHLCARGTLLDQIDATEIDFVEGR